MIKRYIYQELQDHLTKPEISLITGARQVGKTTLMRLLEKDLLQNGAKTLFLNLDSETDKKFFIGQKDLIRKIELDIGHNKGFVFIDEIQRKENAGLFLKGLYDMGLPCKFIVSGSGSLELKEKIHESLAGRKQIFEVKPVTLQEFIDFQTEYKYEGRLHRLASVEPDHLKNLMIEYLNFGGYPRVVTEQKADDKRKIIDEIFSSYMQKDIAYLLNIERTEAFSNLIKLLAANIGKTVNYSSLASSVGLSIVTLKKYMWYAEKTFTLTTITPYFNNPNKEITKAPVVYFNDIGLRNYSLGLFGNITNPNELGFIFQNLVFNLIEEKIRWSGANTRFWRTKDKAEVDFIINQGKDIIPVEVKYQNLTDTRLPRSLKSFINRYRPARAFVVNLTLDAEIDLAETKISFISPGRFLQETIV